MTDTVPVTRLDTDEFVADSHATFERLRDAGAVVPVVISGGIRAWLITRHAEAEAALADPRMAKDVRHWRAFGAGEVPMTGDVAVAARRNILSTDPPGHTRLRRVLASAFTPRRIEALRPWVTAIVAGLVDGLAARDHADLVAEFALPIPMTVICELFAIPEASRPRIRAWTQTLFHAATLEQMAQASAEIDAVLASVVEDKRENPGDDFPSALIAACDAGTISAEELVSLLRAMLAGGNETTINLLGNTASALLHHPGVQRAVIADPGLWPRVIDEVLRWDAPIQNSIWRFATTDIEIDGTVIPAGDPVIVGLASAGRDTRICPEAGSFDISRTRQPLLLSFGRGRHYCIGAGLARLETQVALSALFGRLPDLRLAPDAELGYRRSTMSRGLTALPVVYTPRPGSTGA